ncbi:IclR family transcriptional regulator [Alkalihalobacillus trypoxylicola]|uniref:Glycerol operon regulatory protein n=1 Tax=Alkalihalobacillus trypoxylicola TaxID=519424 RepID=A0A162DDS5_9BACI|nr:IclR family transcriptional regulator [Alkalihalobacillus trypoxylicola]KYG29307.1 hypothetical protein AZF04_07210 [Alkalihalobacillus trypoxylicola]
MSKLINSVDRALRIVDLFTESTQELKLTEISQALNLHKSTVHGLLKTLAYHGYIEQDKESEKYRLGLRFLEKGTNVLNHLDVRRIARPHIEKIANQFGETTHLALLEEGEAVYIDKIEGQSAIVMYSRIGKRAPIYCTAIGKVLVSQKDDNYLTSLSKTQTYHIYTERTIKNEKEFLTAIQTAAENGYAVDHEELEVGLTCIAVPIYNNKNQVNAAISISGPTARLNKPKMEEIVFYLKSEAAIISKKLGYSL